MDLKSIARISPPAIPNRVELMVKEANSPPISIGAFHVRGKLDIVLV